MILNAFTDGASRNNPGEAGIGIVIKNEQGKILLEKKQYLGVATNNVAEYTALIRCIEAVIESKTFSCSTFIAHTDSELMARQLKGEYKVKDPELKKLFQKVQLLLASANFSFTIKHIPRSQNKEADRLANIAINEKK